MTLSVWLFSYSLEEKRSRDKNTHKEMVSSEVAPVLRSRQRERTEGGRLGK